MPLLGAHFGEISRQWLALLITIRAVAALTAVVLLGVHRVTEYDTVLIVLVIVWTLVTGVLARRWPVVTWHPFAWGADIAAVLALVMAASDWRSPFYLLALTTLATPAAALRPRHALGLGVAFSAAYAVIGHIIGPSPMRLGTQATIETLGTHLVLPVLVAFGISYAADAVRRLREERSRAERLAIEAERKRIAWELHDSAKQRVHAAHLVLDSVSSTGDERTRRVLGQVLDELRAAAADMDTSVAELRSPLEGRPMRVALQERADALTVERGPKISIHGDLPVIGPLRAAHAYRIAAEALSNAVRHARATEVEVSLAQENGHARVVVRDDGVGFTGPSRPQSNGLRVMRNRAETIGADLRIGPPPDGGGTVVDITFPLEDPYEEPA